MFKVSSTPFEPKASLLRIEGEIDVATASKMKEAFESLFAKGVYRIVLDIEKITFIASAGLGCLLTARDVILKHAGNLILAGKNPKVVEVFELLGIASLLRFAPTLDGARAQLNA